MTNVGTYPAIVSDGEVLNAQYINDMVADIQTKTGKTVKVSSSAPTTSTTGLVGDLIIVSTTGVLYECTALPVSPSTDYTWTALTYQLSKNDYTDAEKTKLSGIESGAEVNVLEGVKVNGTDLEISGKKSNILVPVIDTENDPSAQAVEMKKLTYNGQDYKFPSGSGSSLHTYRL